MKHMWETRTQGGHGGQRMCLPYLVCDAPLCVAELHLCNQHKLSTALIGHKPVTLSFDLQQSMSALHTKVLSQAADTHTFSFSALQPRRRALQLSVSSDGFQKQSLNDDSSEER